VSEIQAPQTGRDVDRIIAGMVGVRSEYRLADRYPSAPIEALARLTELVGVLQSMEVDDEIAEFLLRLPQDGSTPFNERVVETLRPMEEMRIAVLAGRTAWFPLLNVLVRADGGTSVGVLNSALRGAARGGYSDLIDVLIEQGATDIDEAMVLAAEYGHEQLMERMIGMLPNPRLGTALIVAASEGRNSIADILLNMGARNYDEAMRYAAWAGFPETVEYLHNWQKDKRGLNAALEGAAEAGDLNFVIRLIEKGADDINGAFVAAVKGGHRDTIEELRRRGATNVNGGLIAAAESGNDPLIRMMIGWGANDWDEALGAAAAAGHGRLALDMIGNGANPNTALIEAAQNGYIELVELLTTLPLVIDDLDFPNAFSEAVENGHTQVVHLMMHLVDDFDDDELGLAFVSAVAGNNVAVARDLAIRYFGRIPSYSFEEAVDLVEQEDDDISTSEQMRELVVELYERRQRQRSNWT